MNKIFQSFAESVKEKLAHHVKKIILFGSYARGDNNKCSDIDVLIVVDKKSEDIENIILDESVKILNDYNELIGVIIYDEQEWDYKKYFPLGRNIMKEGIPI